MIRRILVTWIIMMLGLVAIAWPPGISQTKGYPPFPVFNQVTDCDRETARVERPLSGREKQERIDKLTSEIASLEAKMKSGSPEFEVEEHVWEAEVGRPVEWQPLEVLELQAGRGLTLDKLADGSIKVRGRSTSRDTFIIKARTNLRGITAFRLELLPDPHARGVAVLSEFRVSATNEAVLLHDASSDLTGDDQVSRAIDNRVDTDWKFPLPKEQAHAAVFQTSTPLGETASTLLTFALVQNHGKHGTLGHFRICATTTRPPMRELPETIRSILQLEPTERTETQRAEIANYFRPLAASTRDRARQIETKKSELTKIKPVKPASR